MKHLRKKGFTLVELVIVIAIIALFTAMLLPGLTASGSLKNQVTEGARDFYVATQHLFSKFAKLETTIATVTGAANEHDPQQVVIYDRDFGGNRPNNKYAFVMMHVVNTQIQNVVAFSGEKPQTAMASVLQNQDEATNGAFETMFQSEMQSLFEAQDGFYYALVKYDDSLGTKAGSVVKVVMAGYGDKRLANYPAGQKTDDTAYFKSFRDENLHIMDEGQLYNGDYFGVQSSEMFNGSYIGEGNTYFAVVE